VARVPRVRLTDAWQFWLAVVGAIGVAGGITGAVTGILAYRKSSRMDERSATATEDTASTAREALQVSKEALDEAKATGQRSAEAAERSADEAGRATQAADRSADSAENSARDARTMTRIEAGRRHDEIGPAQVSVTYLWRPTPRGGGVWAVMLNRGVSDLSVDGYRVWESGGTESRGYRVLHPGVPAEFWFEDLDMTAHMGPAASNRDGWNPGVRQLNRQHGTEDDLSHELEQKRDRFGTLVLKYRSAEPCPCDRQPPSADYGHWERRYPVERLEI
jgi:hypothetical protein